MCAIFGWIGEPPDTLCTHIIKHTLHRGRDAYGNKRWDAPMPMTLANRRATPTPEALRGRVQPYDGVVHNGTIANDKELGAQAGEIDSEVLPRVLDRTSLPAFHRSLSRVRGSYAVAARADDGRDVYLACNYKPLWTLAGPGWTAFASLAEDLVPEGSGFLPRRLPPYTAAALSAPERTVAIAREQPNRAVVICSSGLDSTVAATVAQRRHAAVCLLHFAYGCRAGAREWAAVQAIAAHMRCPSVLLPIDYAAMARSTLLDPSASLATGIEGAEFAHEWVPARNFVMLALATAYAEANGYGYIYLGNNLEEAGAYPDNEEQWTMDVNAVLYGAVQNGVKIELVTPLGHLMKHEIVALGVELGTPLALTWSCYRGGDRHCGNCGPCFMRRTAFERNGLKDPVML
jgi:7-cyano-7-deazaguanine synthase